MYLRHPATRVLALLALILFSIGCQGGDGSIREQISNIASKPDDVTTEAGIFRVRSEGFVAGDDFSEFSGGLLGAASHGTSPGRSDAFERTFQDSDDRPFREHGWPALVYSAVILFRDPDVAERFFESARNTADGIDWFKTNPGLQEGESAVGPVVQEISTPACDSWENFDNAEHAQDVDEVYWLHVSGFSDDDLTGTITDDILILREGALWAMVRVPDYALNYGQDDRAGRYPFDTFTLCKFEALFAVPVAARMVDSHVEARLDGDEDLLAAHAEQPQRAPASRRYLRPATPKNSISLRGRSRMETDSSPERRAR